MSNLAPRQSPFRRQPSTNTAPSRSATPSSSPTKPSLFSPARAASPASNGINATRMETMASPSKQQESTKTTDIYSARSHLDTPVKGLKDSSFASPSLSITSDINNFDSPSTQILHDLNSTMAPVSAPSRIGQPVFGGTKPTPLSRSNPAHSNLPAPLLRSFRESFEVLDPEATGALNPSSLPPVLEQLGLSNDTSLTSFFPPNRSQNINLATYLDLLSDPFGQLSPPEELAAAFGAFDIDDSGQIDVQDLRQAILTTMPEPGEINQGAKLNESEVDSILQAFTGRRAFSARGLGAQKNARGDVFKWRDFVGSLGGGTGERAEVTA